MDGVLHGIDKRGDTVPPGRGRPPGEEVAQHVERVLAGLGVEVIAESLAISPDATCRLHSANYSHGTLRPACE